MTIAYARTLVYAARSGERFAGDDLADLVEHLIERPDFTIAEALGERPAEPTPLWIRDTLIQQYAGGLGKLPSVRAQAQAVLAAARRYQASDSKGTEDESVLVNRLHEIGVGDLSERTVRRILGAR